MPRASQGEGKDSDTIHVRRPLSKKKLHVPITPTRPLATINNMVSSTGGIEDISLTSPSIVPTPMRDTGRAPKRKAEPAPDRTVSSALRRLVATSGKGSAHDPIVLEEYSPRRKPALLPKRRRTEPEPHRFQDRHRKLYTYRPSRTALAPKPAHGSTFTGDKSNDLYRMMNAKMTAEGCIPPVPYGPTPVADTNVVYGVPFEVQYPKSAQYLAKLPVPPAHPPPSYAQYHDRMGITLEGDSEDMLRKKAVQCIREHSRPQPRKKTLSADPDETSASETEQATSSATRKSLNTPYTHAHTSSSATRTSKLNVYQDPNDHLSTLITQSSIQTALLQAYPRSIDQKGLREDIAMLVAVQNQCLAAWMEREAAVARRRGRSNTDSAISVSSDTERAKKAMRGLEEDERKEKERDEEVRRCLSAGARMWQDGSGLGVADVFAAEAEGAREGSGVERVKMVEDDVKGQDGRRMKGVCGLSMAEY